MNNKVRISCISFSVFLGLFLGGTELNAQDKNSNKTSGLNFQYLETTEMTNSEGVVVRNGPDYVFTSVPRTSKRSLRATPVAAPWQPGDPSWEIPRRRGTPAIINPRPINPRTDPTDPLLARQNSVEVRVESGFSTPIHNFDGLRSSSSPNDPNGEIGIGWYVSSNNAPGGAQYLFYDKTDPSITEGPFVLDNLDDGGPCSNGRGDPIVIYDEMADRWLLTEFSNGTNRLCVFISQTSDPLGDYYIYAFDTPSFPDYPKYAVWGDAYYVGANESSSSLLAFDREAMLEGDPATSQRFTITDPGGFGFAMIPPVDHDGEMPPPEGEPAVFVRHYDDESHAPGTNNPEEDYLEIFEYAVDFDTPANSAVTGPTRIAIAEIDSDLCGLSSFFCFPQMGSGTTLDPLREVVMNLPKYRNFGNFESIVGNLVTDVDGADHGGVRWFELRRSGSDPWVLHQEGTVAPDDEHRFMGASAMDKSGNIALGYSTTSSSIFPAVRYTGRLSSDPLGTMPITEVSLIEGTGPSPGNRWGDYASLSVDPEDGCTFWFIQNYAIASGDRRQNRIGAFKFDSCEEESAFEMTGDNLDQQICTLDQDLSDVALSITGELNFSNLVSLDFSVIPDGITGTFTPDEVTPDGSSIVSFMIDDELLTPGLNEILLRGTADNIDMTGTIERTVELDARIFTAVPGQPSLLLPADSAIGLPSRPQFSWDAGEQSEEVLFEIATDVDFNDVVYSAIVVGDHHSISASLDGLTQYYWRVSPANQCGPGVVSEVFTFTTAGVPAEICASPASIIPDNDSEGVTSDINIFTRQTLLDLEIRLDITHSWVSDLDVILEHLISETSVVLINNHCPGSGGNGDIEVLLDDEGETSVSVCNESSPVIDGLRVPDNLLSSFNGLRTDSTWRLKVVDQAGENVGMLNEWCLLHTSEIEDDEDQIFYDGFEQY